MCFVHSHNTKILSQITSNCVRRNWFRSSGGSGGEGGKGGANHCGVGEVFVLLLGGGGWFGLVVFVLLLGDGSFGKLRNLTQERPSFHLRACFGHVVRPLLLFVCFRL